MCCWYMLFKHLAYVSYKLIHIIIRLVNVIKNIVTRNNIINKELYKRDNISDISHRFFIFALSYH